MDKTFHIYTLSNPITKEVKYVGCTINPDLRLLQHLSDKSQKRKKEWIDSLKEKGLVPKLDVLITTNDVNEASKLEISQYHKYNNGNLICGNPEKSKYKYIIKKVKNSFSFTLSEDAMKLLKKLAEKNNRSQANMIEELIKEAAKKEKIK